MAEYIDKQAVIDEVDEWYNLYSDSDTAREALSLLKRSVKKMSPTDVCPIIRGNWIYSDEPYPGQNPYGHYECDVCFESVPHPTRYCPKCGAYMKGKNDD